MGARQSATNLLKLDFDYGTTSNNGNVLSQTITVPTVGTSTGFTAEQTYTYDSLNRLKSATENLTPTGGTSTQTWKQTFNYDRYGNRTFDETVVGGNPLTTTLTRGCTTSAYNPNGICDKKKFNPNIAATDNRIIEDQDTDSSMDYEFDAAGNTEKDAGGRTFTYDAENKQTLVMNGTLKVGEYFYDGDGKRVKKIAYDQYGIAEETTIFVYDASSKLVAEYSTQVAQQSEAKVSYLTSDHLGSPRILTDANGNVISRRDFHPFGEEIGVDTPQTAGRNTHSEYGGDNLKQKFTSYERDGETDLDFAKARMYGYQLGRFTSPDDFTLDTHPSDPQSWNLYVYARNNPTNLVDPLGTKATISSTYDEKTGITTIKIKASFAVYGAEGQNVSAEDLAKYAAQLVTGIKKAYDGGYVVDGKGFVIETDIDVNVFTDEQSAMDSGADNLVGLGYDRIVDDEGEGATAAAFQREGENFDRVVATIGDTFSLGGAIIQPNRENTFSHEFAHLLGVSDNTTLGSLFNTNNPASRLSIEDFNVLFPKERSVNAGIPSPPSWDGKRPAGTQLKKLEGSRIQTSTIPTFENRRTRGADLYRWVKRVK